MRRVRPPRQVTNRLQLSGPQRLRWAIEYLIDNDPLAAAKRMGLDPVMGPRLLGEAHMQRLIADQRRERAQRLGIGVDEVLARLTAVAWADVNEIVQHRRAACRFCHGEGHRFQFAATEWGYLTQLYRFAYEDGLEQRRSERKRGYFVNVPKFQDMPGFVQTVVDRQFAGAYDAGYDAGGGEVFYGGPCPGGGCFDSGASPEASTEAGDAAVTDGPTYAGSDGGG